MTETGPAGEQHNREKRFVTPRTFAMYMRNFRLSESQLQGMSILDVGAGLSDFTEEAVKRGANAVALDPIYAFLEGGYDKFHKKLEETGVPIKPIGIETNVDEELRRRFDALRSTTSKVAGSHQAMPFPAGHFKLSVAHNSIGKYTDRNTTRQALREIDRVLDKKTGELRSMPANIARDSEGKLYIHTFEGPNEKSLREARKLKLDIGPDREMFSILKEMEDKGYTIYMFQAPRFKSESEKNHPRAARLTRSRFSSPTYVFVMRRGNTFPQLEGEQAFYKLSFKASTDGIHVPHTIISKTHLRGWVEEKPRT